ncbi:cytochrome P450 2L1-like isoform X2 [Artemia franciscana]
MSRNLVQTFERLGKKYGDIISLQIGVFDAIVLNDYKIIRDAYKDDVMNGRPKFHFCDALCEGNNGILFAEGPEYEEIRRFTFKQLRQLGLGKSTLEDTIISEIKIIEDDFKKFIGVPTDIRNKFSVPVVNALWTITTGERFSNTDNRVHEVLDEVFMCMQTGGVACVRHLFPYLRHLPPLKRQAELRYLAAKHMKDLFNETINRHLEYESEDFVGLFLKQIKESGEGSPFHGKQGLLQLKIVLMDLFLTGADTTSTFLGWFFLLMAAHPDIQKKIQDEVDAHVGQERKPGLTDKHNLKYVEACIQEALRFISMAPVITHKVTDDKLFYGYDFKKGTLLFANIARAMRDPSVWEKPNEFYPEHFLNGRKVPDAFMPFGTGKRICIGESLARMELFLFITHLLQVFTFSLKDGDTACFEPINPNVLVLAPKPYEIVLKARY